MALAVRLIAMCGAPLLTTCPARHPATPTAVPPPSSRVLNPRCLFPPTHPPALPPGDFPSLVNSEIVAIQRVQTAAGEAHLRGLIEAHVERTGAWTWDLIVSTYGAHLYGAASWHC